MKKRRGFIQVAILHLLQEETMHGYQIMKELEERSGGTYTASAGTIYPALQELLDQEMIKLEADSDKKVYSLTNKGANKIKEVGAKHKGVFWLEWKERMTWRNSKEATQLKSALEQWELELKKTIKHARGKPEKIQSLTAMIKEMTERLKKEL